MLTQHRPMRRMLMIHYAARAAGVAAFVPAPKTPMVMLLSGVWLGGIAFELSGRAWPAL